jgi:D-alanyl-lipoteichoic acid acyltransferase DltB (MBOAT superfamily)
MFQKVLIGDTAAKHVDHIFSDPTFYSSYELIFSLLMFSIQIYADFSGYSKIAKGSAKLFGIDLIDNFNQPYFSKSITEFWRRWHISLSQWLKEYLYIFWLGGNRKGKYRTYFNLMATMLLGGLWHGANWTFLVWGGIHGLALIINKLIDRVNIPSAENRSIQFISNGLKIIFTFVIVVLAWLFFRAPDFSTAWYYLDKMFVDWSSTELAVSITTILIAYYAVVLLMDFLEVKFGEHEYLSTLPKPIRYGIYIPMAAVIILYLYTVGKPMPFIYFQF